MNPLWMWLGFNIFVLVLLALDLGVLHRKGKEVGIREALLLSLGYDRGVMRGDGEIP